MINSKYKHPYSLNHIIQSVKYVKDLTNLNMRENYRGKGKGTVVPVINWGVEI
jgi:hypothetical protein